MPRCHEQHPQFVCEPKGMEQERVLAVAEARVRDGNCYATSESIWRSGRRQSSSCLPRERDCSSSKAIWWSWVITRPHTSCSIRLCSLLSNLSNWQQMNWSLEESMAISLKKQQHALGDHLHSEPNGINVLWFSNVVRNIQSSQMGSEASNHPETFCDTEL